MSRRGKTVPLRDAEGLERFASASSLLATREGSKAPTPASSHIDLAPPSAPASRLDPSIRTGPITAFALPLSKEAVSLMLAEASRGAVLIEAGSAPGQSPGQPPGSSWSLLDALETSRALPPVPVLFSHAPDGQFLAIDRTKNDPASPYFVREPETKTLEMTPSDFFENARAWKGSALCLDLPLLERTPSSSEPQAQSQSSAPAPPNPWTVAFGLQLKPGHGLDRLPPAATFSSPIGPPPGLLRVLHASLQLGRALEGRLIVLSHVGTLLPCRYALHDRLLLGASTAALRVSVFPPTACFDCLYPFPVHHPYDGYAMPDVRHLDRKAWPSRSGAPLACHQALLTNGRVLFVPAGSPVVIEATGPLAALLSLTCADVEAPGRAPLPGLLELRVARAVETVAVDAVGVLASRRFLRAVAAGPDALLTGADPFSLSGSQRLVAADHIERLCALITDSTSAADAESPTRPQLPSDSPPQQQSAFQWRAAAFRPPTAAFLERMCFRRMLPTPWLNAVVRDPLLLPFPPRVEEDDRTEEERRFPELFRAQIEARVEARRRRAAAESARLRLAARDQDDASRSIEDQSESESDGRSGAAPSPGVGEKLRSLAITDCS